MQWQSSQLIVNSLAGSQQWTDRDASFEEDGNPLKVTSERFSLLELVHAALHVRNDMIDTPGHETGWRGINPKEHMEKIIPNSLYLFLSIVFGGKSALNLEVDEQDEEVKRI